MLAKLVSMVLPADSLAAAVHSRSRYCCQGLTPGTRYAPTASDKPIVPTQENRARTFNSELTCG
jgi:hypothetical protein